MLDKVTEENEKAKKINWDKLDTPVEHYGKAITLPGPPNMPLRKAIEALERKAKDEEQEVMVAEWIEGYPHDGAVAFAKAMRNLYGWASAVPTPTFFGPQPPQMLSIKTGHRDEDVVLCPMGSFQLPGVENRIQTGITRGPRDIVMFVVHGKVRQKEKHILLELATEARRLVREESIYRGKAIRISVGDDGELDTKQPPQFLDVSSENILIFDSDIQDEIDDSVMTPIASPEDCRALDVPGKRTILVHGRYGTGKSLLAREAAKVCERHGRTFILLDKVQGLKEGLEFANFYAPALVFAEDIDRITEVRDDSANDLVNMIDGVVSKTSQVMTILTTNFVEKIDQVMLRPGRLDAVIELRTPTLKAVERLLRVYAGRLLDPKADVSEAAAALSGQIPATIRECVDRAKLGMIRRRDNKLSNADLVVAARTMKNHLALLNREVKKETAPETLARSLREVLNLTMIEAMGGTLNANYHLTDKVDDKVDETRELSRSIDAKTELLPRTDKRVKAIYDKTIGNGK